MTRGMKKQAELSASSRTGAGARALPGSFLFAGWLRTALVIAVGAALAASPAAGQADPNAAAVEDLLGAPDGLSLGIDWAALFSETGALKDDVDATGAPGSNGVDDFRDLYGGIDACAIEDKISAGVILDMSVLSGGPAIADCRVNNGTVASSHDLGNGYMYTTYGSSGDLVVYMGIERLRPDASGPDTHHEIELNQLPVRVKTGKPWPVRGERTANDLLIRVNYSLGIVSSVDVSRWAIDGLGNGSFQALANYGGLDTSSCNGAPGTCLFCGGAPPIAAPQEVWDAAGEALDAVPPDDFFEIGVNVRALLGANIDYSAIQVRTPEDIALGGFIAIGYWSN